MDEFLVKVLAVGVMVAILAALVGVPMVLRRNAMLSDGLSHVGFGAFMIAMALGFTPLYVALPIVILVSFLILRLGKNAKVTGDAAIAMMSVSALAVGMLIASATGVDVDVDHVLFGDEMLVVENAEIVIASICFVTAAIFYVAFYNKIFAISFDEKFARAIGIKVDVYNAIFALICSVVVVLGMRVMGALLISALVVFPTLISKMICKNFKGVVVSSAVVSAVCLVVGVLISNFLNLPTGPVVVVCNLSLYLVVWTLNKAFK